MILFLLPFNKLNTTDGLVPDISAANKSEIKNALIVKAYSKTKWVAAVKKIRHKIKEIKASFSAYGDIELISFGLNFDADENIIITRAKIENPVMNAGLKVIALN